MIDKDFFGSRCVTFVPCDPPRTSWFALWDPEQPGGLDLGSGNETAADDAHERVDLDVIVPARRGSQRATVSAVKVPVGDAIDGFAALGHADPASPSAHAWAGVVRAGLALIADGRILPWISPGGWDTWRVDPLNAKDLEFIDSLVAALPAGAHALPTEQRGRIGDPAFAIRSCFDALADAFVRTAAAHRVGELSLFADRNPTQAPQLRPWANDLARSHCTSANLTLRVHPPEEEGEDWLVRFQLQSREDPSLVVDAADFWETPTEVMQRLGEQAEVTLLAGLRRLGEHVEPLAAVLDQVAPVDARLSDDELDLLLDRLDELADLNIDVRWPSELVAPRIERQVVASAGSPGNDLPTVFDLESLLTVDWEFLLDGIPLNAEELDVLGEAKRAVVPLRGKWVRLDRASRDRLRARPPKIPLTTALAAALGAQFDPGDLTQLDASFGPSDLNAEELDVLGEAKRAVVPLRGKWVRLDRASRDRLRARPPKIPLTTALAAALGAQFDPGDLTQLDASFGPSDLNDEEITIRVDGALKQLAERLLEVAGSREAQTPPALQAELRPYQQRGLAWMSDLCDLGLGGCLADDMGLGKTVQLLALHAHRGGRTLVVCPTSLLNNWAREAERFLPNVPVRIFHGGTRSIEDLGTDEIVITTYGVVRSDAELLDTVAWDLIVADEAQHAKNPRSRTARALREISGRSRIALTGTPVENRLSELWSIIDWTVPGLLGSLETFRRRYGLPIERDNDRDAATALNALVRPFLLRRKKTDPGIAPDLPPKLERDVVVPLTPEQVTLYKATVDESLAEVNEAEGIARRGLVLKLLTGLKQITNHPAQYLGEAGPLPERSGKLDALEDLLNVARDMGESTLVFTQYVAMGELLVQHLSERDHRIELLHGSQSVSARQDLVDRFQAGELDVLVLSLKAGGTGLNLTAATNVVHYDRWWNPAVEDQATDRAYRIGQSRTVTVHRIITEGTVEDRVAELLNNKRKLADRVVGTGEGWIGDLDDEQLGDLVRLGAA